MHRQKRFHVRARVPVHAFAVPLFGVGSKPLPGQRRAQAQALAAADEHGLRARVADGIHCGNKRERGREHLIAAAHARHEHGQMQA